MNITEKYDEFLLFFSNVENKSKSEIEDMVAYLIEDFPEEKFEAIKDTSKYYKNVMSFYKLLTLKSEIIEFDLSFIYDYLLSEINYFPKSEYAEYQLIELLNFIIDCKKIGDDSDYYWILFWDFRNFLKNDILIQDIIKRSDVEIKDIIKELIENRLKDSFFQTASEMDKVFFETLKEMKNYFVDFVSIPS